MENINLKESTIIDVRSRGEFSMGNVEGSVNIPLNEIPDNVEDIKNMKRPIVLCCASGNRSGQALNYLLSRDVDDCYNGGMWGLLDSWTILKINK